MIYVAISLSALALVASAAVAVWLITSSHRTRELERLQSRTESDLQRLAVSTNAANESVSARLRELETKAPTKLAAEVAALADAVANLGDTHRRFAGKVWARIGHDERAAEPASGDAHLQALLALQSAAPRAQ